MHVRVVERGALRAPVASEPRASLIATRRLCVSYGSTSALSDVSFSAASGELIAVVGPNGAGKSSLMKALVGLIDHRGEVSLHGRECHHGQHRHSVAYIPQRHDLDLDFPISAQAVVASGRRRFRRAWQRPTAKDRNAASAALERVGVAHLATRRINELSGGELQRVLLARALAQEADVLLLDESLSGVDQLTASALIELLAELAGGGATLLVTTHDLDLARRQFARCLAVNRTIVADGPPAGVLDAATIEATFARVAEPVPR